MGVLDWLHKGVEKAQGAEDTLDSFLGNHLGFYQNWMDNEAASKQPNDSWYSSLTSNGQYATQAVGAGLQKVEAIPTIGPAVKFTLDLPNRSFDTYVNVLAHADNDPNRGWFAAAADKDSWNQAWSSWGDPDHVSAGQIIAAKVGGTNVDPLNAQKAKIIRDGADDTWYSSLIGATTDLAAGFVSPLPGAAGVLKAAREAKAVSTVADAERIATAEKGLFDAGNLGSDLKASKARSTGRAFFKQDQNPHDHVARLAGTLRHFNDKYGTDLNGWKNGLGGMLENTADEGVVKLASVMSDVNRVIEDPLMREHVQMNSLLSVMGSSSARAELASAAPLVAKSLMHRMAAPPEIELQSRLAESYGQAFQSGRIEDFDPGKIVDDFYNSPADKAELAALKEQLDQAADYARVAKGLDDARNNPGRFNNPDLRVMRQQSIGRATLSTKRLRQARADLADAKKQAKRVDPKDRFARGQAGSQISKFASRVKELEEEAAAAKADRDLFHSTPLDDPQRATLEAQKRTLAAQAKEDQAQAVAVRKNLTSAHNRLNDFYSLTDDVTAGGGRVMPTKLDQAKTWYRDKIGEDYLFSVGDANRQVRLLHYPKVALAAIGTRRARGAINTNEVSVGSEELAESLRRSKVFDGDEIHDIANQFLGSPREQRALLVKQVEEDMVKRIASRDFSLTDNEMENALKLTRGMYGKGRAHLARAADEQADQKIVTITDPETGQANALDGAWLRSHLEDTTGFIDPAVVRATLKQSLGGGKGAAAQVLHRAGQVHDGATMAWKHGVLLRPGLGVRAMLDTGMRATALLGVATEFANAVNGAAHLVANRGNGALVRLGAKNIEDVATQALGMAPVKVDIGGGKSVDFTGYDDLAQMSAHQMALAKGGNPSRAFRASTTKQEALLEAKRASWSRRQPGAADWHAAYTEYASVLGASPTARRIMEWLDDGNLFQGPELENLTRDIMRQKGVKDEYLSTRKLHGESPDEYVQEIANQVNLMFPTKELRDAYRKGVFNKKGGTGVARKHFPDKPSQFEVPGPDSLLGKDGLAQQASKLLDKFYRTVLDKPDMWLARHPVYVSKSREYFQNEVKAYLKTLDEGESIPESVIRTMEARAKTEATQLVRRTFYDNSRYTGAHAVVTKIAPFFMPFEDAMTSWGRLLYDDPKRIFRLSGAWYAGENVSPYMSNPLVVDQYGNPVQRGNHDDGDHYIALPVKIAGAKMRWNKNSLNSIAQGNVWWQPGFGPVSQVGVSTLLGQVMPPQVALDLVGSDNWLGKSILKSLYFDGELPPSDAKSQAVSLLPSWARNMALDIWGTNFGDNVGYSLNAQYLESLKSGVPFDQKKALARAKKEAHAAGWVRSISSFGLGMSGNAVVDGEFYVDQMRMLQALTPEQLKQMGYSSADQAFMAEFPDAADLDWYGTKNETGISPTINAQKAALRNKAIIEDHPEYGWFVVGSDNVGGDYSRTAYNQQRSNTYGWEKLGRKKESATDQIKDTLVSQGWHEFDKVQAVLREAHKQVGDVPKWDDFASFYRKQFTDKMQVDNPTWYKEYVGAGGSQEKFWAAANQIADDPGLKNRPDMVLFRDYRAARKEILEAVGMKSLSGTSEKAAYARQALRTIGEKYAEQNLGFQQTWDRMLAREVEPKDGDEILLTGGVTGG